MAKNKLSLLIALFLGLITALVLRSYIMGVKQSAYEGMEFVSVVVAKKNLPEETVLEKSLIRKRKIPHKFLPGGVVLEKDHQLILGQPLQIPVKTGEPILWAHLGTEEKGALSNVIPQEKRALTIGVDDLTGVGGMISPHDHVDIVLTYTDPNNPSTSAEVKTVTLLQDISVLAVGRHVSEYQQLSTFAQTPGYSSVTLCVSPLEAELLVFAQEHGRLWLTLRNPQDREKQKLPEMNIDHLRKEVRGAK